MMKNKIIVIIFTLLFILNINGDMLKSNPYFAGALSWYYPGAGQLYNGKVLKGTLFFTSELTLLYIASNLVSDVSFRLEESVIISPKPQISQSKKNLSLGLFTMLGILHLYNIFDAAHDSMKINLTNSGKQIIPKVPAVFPALASFIMPGTGQMFNGEFKKGSELIFYNLLLKIWKVYIDYDLKNKKGQITINWNKLNYSDRITFLAYYIINFTFRFYSAYDAYVKGEKNIELVYKQDDEHNNLLLMSLKF